MKKETVFLVFGSICKIKQDLVQLFTNLNSSQIYKSMIHKVIKKDIGEYETSQSRNKPVIATTNICINISSNL